jgi:hypothetical protein
MIMLEPEPIHAVIKSAFLKNRTSVFQIQVRCNASFSLKKIDNPVFMVKDLDVKIVFY